MTSIIICMLNMILLLIVVHNTSKILSLKQKLKVLEEKVKLTARNPGLANKKFKNDSW